MMSKQVSRPNRPLTLRDIENRAILEGLDRNGGNKVKTADDLGISLKTLYNKLHQATEEPLDRTA